MYSKTSLMALCAAAAVKEVAAGHGHQHAHADKREIVWASTETVVITDYITVTVTGGQEPTSTASVPTTVKVHRPHHSHSQQSSAPVTTADTTTSVVIAETSSSVAVPTVIPTTMITAVKPTTSVLPPVVSTPTEITSVVQPTTTAVPTTTAIPTTSATPQPTTGSGGKRGLAYNDASLVQEFLTLGGQASWAYNWGSTTGDLPAGVAYYPMLWSPAPDHSNGWDAAAKSAIANGADALLGFNEPDIASQANMSPQDAATNHIQWMNPYAGQARIGSPAVSSSENANQGGDWLSQFFTACAGQCKVDFCVAHWYGPGGADGADLFLNHLDDIHNKCDGKPVWVTEFAAESGDVDAFMTKVVTSLETDSKYSYVEKYSYFMASVGDLFSSPTELTSFGKIYAGLA